MSAGEDYEDLINSSVLDTDPVAADVEAAKQDGSQPVNDEEDDQQPLEVLSEEERIKRHIELLFSVGRLESAEAEELDVLSNKRKRDEIEEAEARKEEEEEVEVAPPPPPPEPKKKVAPGAHPFFGQFGKTKNLELKSSSQQLKEVPQAAPPVENYVIEGFDQLPPLSADQLPAPVLATAKNTDVLHPAVTARKIDPTTKQTTFTGEEITSAVPIACAQFNLSPCIPDSAINLLSTKADMTRLRPGHPLRLRNENTVHLERIAALLWLLCPRCFGEQAAGVVLYDAAKLLIDHDCIKAMDLIHSSKLRPPPDPYSFLHFHSSGSERRHVGEARVDEFKKTFAGPIEAFRQRLHGIKGQSHDCHDGCKHLQLYRLLDNIEFVPFVLRLDAHRLHPRHVHVNLWTPSSGKNDVPSVDAESCHARIAMSSLFDVFGLPGHGTYSGNSLACEDPSNNVDVIASYPEAHHSQVVQMHEATKDYTTHERLLRAVSINEKEDGAAEAPRVATPDGLRGRLRPHQEESLAFMLERERNGTRDFVEVVVQGGSGRVFTIFYAPTTMVVRVVEKASLDDPCPGRDSINPMIRGGILADEVGLGKTVELMALMVANPSPVLKKVNYRATSVPLKATLVVGTVSICKQWIAECKRFLPQLECLMWHGCGRSAKSMKELASADLIITTYETLKMDFLNNRAPMINACFHRVVFDECQKLAGGTLDSIYVKGNHRWAVSATPINKSYSALYPLTNLLGSKVFNKKLFAVMDGQATVHRNHSFSASMSSFHMVHLHSWDTGDSSSYATVRERLSRGCRPILRGIALSELSMQLVKDASQPAPHLDDSNQPTKNEGFLLDVVHEEGSVIHYVKDNAAYAYVGRGCFTEDYINEQMFKKNRWIVPYFLSRYMIRHVKSDDLLNNLNLPPVHYQHHRVELTEAERKDYTDYVNTIRPTFRSWALRDKIGQNISRIMMWVDNIRRAASSVDLFSVDVRAEFERARGCAPVAQPTGVNAAQDAENQRHNITKIRTVELQAKLAAAGSALPDSCEEIFAGFLETPPVVPECAVCMDVIQDPLMLSCFHFFCRECMLGVLNAAAANEGKCPECRSDTSNKAKYLVDLAPPPPPVVEELKPEPEVKEAAVEDPDAGVCSKVKAIVRTISEISGEDPESKFVIFTHFSGMIGMIQGALRRGGVRAAVIDGSTTLQQRGNIIQGFQGELEANNASRAAKEKFGNLRAVIVSSRAGNAGITLTAANHLILADASIDVVMETQALGRIHRIGQQRPVTIHKFNSANTIEERIAFLFNRGKLSGQGSKNASNAGTTGAGGGSAMIEQMKYFFMDDAEAMAHEAALGPEVPQGGGGGGGPAAPNEP